MDNVNITLGLSNMFTGALIIALCIPLLKDKIKMNHWYGMRFKKSFESEENWYRINRYGAQRMILWSAALVVVGAAALCIPAGSTAALSVIISCAPMIIVIPAIETWLFARKL